MNVGVGAGDFVALVGLAWTVYKSCKDAPDSFGSISHDVLSLHALLKETEETVLQQPMAELSKKRLNSVLQGCYAVLNDLQKLVEKYGSLGRQTKRTWDRMRWNAEEAAELRARLTSSTVLLTGFIATSQVTIQKKLDKFAKDFQDGKIEPSVISTHSIESISADDKEAWREIRKELESIGITIEAFNENKSFIINWFVGAVAKGIFEELRPENISDDSDERATEISEGISDGQMAPTLQQHRDGQNGLASKLQDHEARMSPLMPIVSVGIHGGLSATIKSKAPETPHPPKRHTRLSKVAVPIKKLLERQVLIAATRLNDINKVRAILEDEDSSALVNVKTLSNALNIALSMDNAEMTKLLLEAGTAFDSNTLSSALGISVRRNNATTTQLLFETGAVFTEVALTEALDMAVDLHNNAEIAKLILERGIACDSVALKNTLYRATESNKVEIIKLLIETVTVSDRATLGVALKKARDLDFDEIFALLIKGGATFEEINSTGIPLLWAAETGHLEITQSLLAREADVNERNHWGRTALHEAARCNELAIAEVLLNNGANPNLLDDQGNSPLKEGVRHNDLKVVELLLKNGANPNLVGKLGFSPLFETVRLNNLHLGELLLNNGANPNLPDIGGSSPLIEAARLVLTEPFLEALLDKGANIDAQTWKGETALMIASRRLKFDHMRLLLRHGAKVNLKNQKGRTALDILLEEKERRPDDPAVIMLREHGAAEQELKSHSTSTSSVVL